MSRIDDLIRELCPNGVEFRRLRDLARRNNGTPITAGRMKALQVDGGTVRIFAGGNTVADVPEDAIPPEHITRDPSIIVKSRGHIGFTFYRRPFSHKNELWSYTVNDPGCDELFVYFFLLTQAERLQALARANSVKLPQLTVGQIDSIRIPVPPLEVQREVVRVLDLFQSLEAELEAELEARRRQYAHYRDSLLSFTNLESEIRWVTMGDAGVLFGGLTGKSKSDFGAGGSRYVSYMNVFENLATDVEANDRVRVGDGERQRRLHRGDILFTGSSETPDECGMSSVVTTEPPEPLYLNSFCIGYRLKDAGLLDPEFSKHLFRAASMRAQIVRTANGVTRFNVSKGRLAKVLIPVPRLLRQREIAAILDQFNSLVNDLSIGLPAELAARRKQYEYYRDRLLTFEEAA